MNLVIDDAVEVGLASKNEEEKRRELGELLYFNCCCTIQLINHRSDIAEGR